MMMNNKAKEAKLPRRLGKIKEVKIVPRIGKIISLELLAKQKRAQRGESQTKNRFG